MTTPRDEYVAKLKSQLDRWKLLPGASTTAWQDVARGADAAWDTFRKSLDTARTHFEKT